jgi:uncharacterized protein RhaS with RHS repeats
MKTQMKRLLGLVTLLALFSAPHLASAYYDPGVQRWINRDPIEEGGGLNLYQFLANDAVSETDSWGLLVPPPPVVIAPPVVIVTAPIEVGVCVYAGVAYACDKTGVHEWLANKICNEDEKKKRCDKEWEDAYRMCKEELAKPNPSRGVTGGYKNLMDCARGLVSEECGGNPVDRGKKKKPRKDIRF